MKGVGYVVRVQELESLFISDEVYVEFCVGPVLHKMIFPTGQPKAREPISH